MIAVAALAVTMGLHRAVSAFTMVSYGSDPPVFSFLRLSDVQVFLIVLVLALVNWPIVVYDRFIRRRRRRFSRGQSLLPKTGAETNRGAQESVD
jgi:hypothetical protein